MSRRTEYLVAVLLAAPAVLVLYAFVHEAGHALVALANGATIEEFVFLGPGAHVTWSGGTWTDATIILGTVAGVGLPVLLVLLLLLVYRARVRSITYHVAHGAAVIGVTFTTLLWIAVPLIALTGGTPSIDDDVVHALDAGAPAAVVGLCALATLVLLVGLAVRRGLTTALLEIVREVRAAHTTPGPAPEAQPGADPVRR